MENEDIIGRSTPHRTLARKMEVIKSWLEEEILLTKLPPSNPKRPTRLLDLRSIIDQVTKKSYRLSGQVFLSEVSEPEHGTGTQKHDYLTLSYRWPREQNFVTTLAMYEDFKLNGIEVSSFP